MLLERDHVSLIETSAEARLPEVCLSTKSQWTFRITFVLAAHYQTGQVVAKACRFDFLIGRSPGNFHFLAFPGCHDSQMAQNALH